MITVYEDSVTRMTCELEPGDVVWDERATKNGGWCEVERVNPVEGDGCTWVKKKRQNHSTCYPDDFTFSVATGTPTTYATYKEWIKGMRHADVSG